ncbi:hypothetical protein BDV36DRAFT_287653 [Aspergillus pseudocaelatus]|uniref:N-acetyltransferase domain-containing protein n=1 Tax=Aspergillus pseudocaelatus TaxID=1825620 RepID=A0ABQ6W6H8_9EURO|nr:hypothetical protein BDV36DRAFT_287653 [Aspergillus pseudocaelatus]
MEFNISDIHSSGRSHAFEVLAQIARVEKKAFPTNEAFGFSENFWRKKPKTKVLYYVRQKGRALLHKLFVAESHRRQGVRMKLMLWVNKARTPARCLYLQLGLGEREEITDYYAPEHMGIRMILNHSCCP